MPITKEQAINAHMFHYGTCTRVIGPRGKVTERTEQWRRNGKTQVWVTRPNDYRVPIKYGLKRCSQLLPSDAEVFHTVEDCPLNDPAYTTTDHRVKTA